MVVSLIGYRGSGKTSVARQLAAALGWTWVDCDDSIEERAGCSIREIFDRQGEAEFRRLERAAIQDVLGREHCVLATGGGAILNADTRRDLQTAGPVIWLQAGVDQIEQRLSGDPSTTERRPALTQSGGRREIERLLIEREPLYRECASLAIDTDNRTIDAVVQSVLDFVRQELARSDRP